MTIDHLKNLANTAKFAELFEILDTYFDKNPDYQYSNLKQNIQHQLGNGSSPTPAQLQGLLVFLNGRVVKENLGNFKQAMEAQQNNTATNNGNGNITIQDNNGNVIINNGTNTNQNTNSNQNKTPNMPKKVFISYNHGDKDAARHLKNALVAAGLEVTIDSEAMMAGSKISDFIRKSIQETDVTVSIVSEKSLLSAWVAMESILTLHNQKQFIACYITDKFFDLAFVRSSAETVALRIDNIQKEIQERFTINMGIEDLSDELSRQQDLRHNLPKIIGELRSRLCIDIAGYNFLDNVPKVIKAVKGE